MARPREFDLDEVLSQIMEIFWKEGYEKTSFAMIEEQTGVKKASLCAAYGDKRNLFLTALRRYQERSLQTCQQQSEQGSATDALRQRLRSAARMASGTEAQRGCFQVNCIIEIAPHDPEVAALVKAHANRVAAQFAALIRRGQQNGEFRTDTEASILAKYVISSIYGLSVSGKAGMSAREIERIIEVILSSLEG
ncbi:MAG TPA: TetR/AcrR family transcriptional regulator [Blastocatellia bacterium]|nr:TetR/AcrR family transcriptional regulator [Blastocatellia bacterium]